MKGSLVLLGLAFSLATAIGAEPAPQPRPVLRDAFGDRLPNGAKLRLGTSRYQIQPDYSPNDSIPLALSPDGLSYATTGMRYLPMYWVSLSSSATGRLLWHAGDESRCMGEMVAFTPDGRSVVTTGQNGLAVWDAATGKQRWTTAWPAKEGIHIGSSRMFEFSADLKLAASTFGYPRGPGEKLSLITLWNPTDGKELGLLTAAHQWIHHIALSADGRVLASCGSSDPKDKSEAEVAKAKELEGVIQLWDVREKKVMRRIQTAGRSVAKLSPDGTVLYTASPNGIEAWDTGTGKRSKQFDGRKEARERLWLSADGNRLAAGGEDGAIDVWNTTTGKPLASGQRPPAQRWMTFVGSTSVHQGWFTLALPSEGPAVVAAIDVGRIRLGTIPVGKVASPSGGHRAMVETVGFTADGKHVLSAAGGQVLRWDATTGNEVPPARTLVQTPAGIHVKADWVFAPEFSPDGGLLVRSSTDVRLLDPGTGKQRFTFPGWSGSFSADGKRVAIAEELWQPVDDDGGKVWVTVVDTATGKPVFEKRIAGKAAADVVTSSEATITPDGTKLAWAVSRHRPLKPGGELEYFVEFTGWDLVTGKQLGRSEIPRFSLAFPVAAGDNRSILTGGRDDELVQWELITGKFTRTFGKRSGSPVFAPDGKSFALIQLEGAIRSGFPIPPSEVVVFDWTTGKPTKKITGPAIADVECLAFSPDSKLLVTGHADTTALVWDVASLPAPK